ncbi:MAG: hypothetical protein ACOH1O_04790 [Flavobacterium sp.]
MKKLIFTVLTICSLIIFMSCNRENSIAQIFIAKENEYWKYRDNCQSHGIYFKFKQGGDYDKYLRYINDGFTLFNDDGDLLSGPRSWSIKNDSTFVWDGNECHIELLSNEKIILYYAGQENQDCRIFLLKVVDK